MMNRRNWGEFFKKSSVGDNNSFFNGAVWCSYMDE